MTVTGSAKGIWSDGTISKQQFGGDAQEWMI
jgi:hypothetical protein